jgi:ABC-type antimicrobial peptide transport system permease subunit
MSHLFPEAEGYRGWLIDAPHDKRDEISAHLTNRMADAGLSVETAIERLRLFDLMEDTYLNIFLMLGGLGLLLGCAGLGLIVVRNLLERKGELAMLRAVGFNNKKLFILICYEHGYLLGAGLISGFICAVISVIPVLKAAAGQLPASLLILVAILTGLSGVIWVATASGIALKGDILTPLRNE